MSYRRSGRSGLQPPAVSLGLWHGFGDDVPLERQRAILRRAFDLGVTHFDLANNYGPPYGAAEANFGTLYRSDWRPYRDELVLSTKAGYDMWPGPYGEWGSRKYLLASLDQSLARMGVDYVDVFYSHRADPDTPLEETMGALHTAVQSGRALYAGISSYSPERTRQAAAILRDLGTPLLIHQPSYSMLNRWIEAEPARRAGGRGRGLHRVLPAGAGHAHGQVPARHPGGLARQPGQVAVARPAHRAVAAARAQPARDRPATRPEPGPDGAHLGAARPAGDVGAGGRQQRRAGSRRTSARCRRRRSRRRSLAEVDADAVDAGIDLWARSSGV
ncbi:hypothetical protein GCM10025868_44350 [Angustibacter aerolatus]|uniref:NADP-dependent oxidoreductase domain-containing protein n=1 Tax=Angustibacter aerolatus TaxID=1162965 RepID=A0ABQ6JR67_9ACTN|nr:aldo/keto reductase [Angustibacter aerolatus]GMA89185.1 hypothetical protein GCM10025868_44350 [Angustibacter aerolatus]